MVKPRTVALWSGSVLAALLLALTLAGAIRPVYRWMVRYLAPEVWSAIGTWATAMVALGAAAFAWFQVQEARRTREEQAQPNVVLYMEPNANVPQILEIVMRNFGTTPAYDVRVDIQPPIKSTPNNQTYDKIADIPIPRFPILAPGQEWRTVWDSAVTRKSYLDGLRRKLEAGKISQDEFDEQNLTPRHEATVTYFDSRKRMLETPSIIDFDQRNGTTWLDTKTMHDLTKMLEKQLESQNRLLESINRRLAEFGTEHEGIWTYNSSDDEERQYRRAITAAQRRESRESHDHLDWQLSGRHGDDPLRRINPDEATQAPIEEATIGDWYIPADNGSLEIGQAWRVAFIKRHVYEDFGAVHELFRSDGDSIREREGTQINIARADS
jgi:HAMP domain-containing protein